MEDVFEIIGKAGLMPVITVERVEDAVPLAEALIAGGLPVAEVTFRTEAAAKAIAAMAKVPGLFLGAGTVLRPEQVDEALDLGARFALAPGFNPKVAARALEKKLPFIPGICTASEIGLALEMGFSVQKFFPAEPAGGTAYLKAVSAPFKDVRFVPTGSIGLDQLSSYLELSSVLAVGGSWMVAPKLIQEHRFDEITRLTRAAVDMVQRVRSK
jgi:2-dehydro-3-deoxyphosphogluconate aldolase/(4S)-4-hydroxy-2-oxoglutarate aldolase